MKELVELAIIKAFNENAASLVRDEVDPGKFMVDALVRLKGTLQVGEDHTATLPQKLCPWTLLQIALSKMNDATADTVIDEGIIAVREGRKVETEGIKAKIGRKAAAALEETRSIRKGQVKFLGDVKILEQDVQTVPA